MLCAQAWTERGSWRFVPTHTHPWSPPQRGAYLCFLGRTQVEGKWLLSYFDIGNTWIQFPALSQTTVVHIYEELPQPQSTVHQYETKLSIN